LSHLARPNFSSYRQFSRKGNIKVGIMTFSSHAGKLLALDVHGLPLKVPALFNLFFIPCLACLRVVVNTTANSRQQFGQE
jgi:hypothetical protein